MPRFDGDELADAVVAEPVACKQLAFDGDYLADRFDDPGFQVQRAVGRRRSTQLDGVFHSDSAGWVFEILGLHQMPGGGPIAMTVKQRANDAAVEDAREGFMVGFRRPVGHDSVAVNEGSNAQAFFVGRTAAEASVVGRVGFLQAAI